MSKRKFNLQLFATLDEIIEANADKFEGSNVKEQFETLNGKLTELGFDVLINNKQKAEFVPSSRLGEVVSQRDQFKTKVEELNAQLKGMQDKAGDNQALKDQLQQMMDTNTNLLKDLESTRVNTEIMLSAKDAINAKDLLAFIDYNNIKVNAKGEVLGVEAEITRLKTEKPYLFQSGDQGKKKAGTDPSGGKEDFKTGGMNAMIRKAAGRV